MNTASISIAALKAANACASTEETRYYLNGVLVTVAERHTLYVATDGHCMFVHREDLAEDAEPNTLLGAWIMPSAAIAKAKAGKGRFADKPVTMTQDAEGRLLLTDADGTVQAITKPIDGTFPNWKRVIPRAIEPDDKIARVHFNPEVLARVAKGAGFLGYLPIETMVHTRAANEPAAITFGASRQTFAVAMPARADRLGEWGGLPVWAGGTPPAAEASAPAVAIAAE